MPTRILGLPALTLTIHDKMLHPSQFVFFIPGFYAQPRILTLS